MPHIITNVLFFRYLRLTKKLTIEQKVAQKREKIERLKAEEQRLKAQLREAERRADTRRKILLGSWLLHQAGGDLRALSARLDGYLTRQADRALFDLPSLDNDDFR